VPEQDQATQIRNLQELARRQGTDIHQLGERTTGAEPRAVLRVWGALLPGGLPASTMGTWLVLPVFTSANDVFPSSFMNFGLWDVFASPDETVGGQTGIVMTLLFVVLALGAAALSEPRMGRLYAVGGGAVLLLAAETCLRVGISGEVVGQSTSDSGNSYQSLYAYGGGALSIALVFTAGIAAWAFSRAKSFRE
jgi:hypothetical protein